MVNPLGFTTIFGTVLGLKIRCPACGHIQNKKKYGLLVKKCEECGTALFERQDIEEAFDVYDRQDKGESDEDDWKAKWEEDH